MSQPLIIETLDHDPFAIITLRGSLAGPAVYELKYEGHRLIEYLGRFHIIIDMSGVDFIDSAGIGVLIHFFQACKNMGGRMVAVSPSSADVMRPLIQSSLERIITFAGSLSSAVEGLCARIGLQIPPALRDLVQPSAAAEPPAQEKTLELRLQELEQRVALLEDSLKQKIAQPA